MLSDLLFPMRFPTQRIRAILVLATLILSAAPAMAQVSWPAPPSLVAALRTAATGTITAWEARVGADATAIVEWAKQQ